MRGFEKAGVFSDMACVWLVGGRNLLDMPSWWNICPRCRNGMVAAIFSRSDKKEEKRLQYRNDDVFEQRLI